MKKWISLSLVLILVLSLCACGQGESSVQLEQVVESQQPIKPIVLTKENIADYVSIRGEYKNGTYKDSILYYISSADLEFQAYSTVSGSFENVEITVRANLNEKGGALNEKWHLVNSDDEKNVQFTFKLSTDGEYNASYSIECARNTWKLNGDSDLEIISVSGTFIPKY